MRGRERDRVPPKRDDQRLAERRRWLISERRRQGSGLVLRQ